MNAPADIGAILDRELTAEQRAAATDESADVLVIACAGSGKSRTLAYRIAWMISNGADPESIVAFTFTEKAADTIRQRVATALDRIGRHPTEVGKVSIGTIHGYCWDLLRRIDARYRQFDVLDRNGLRLFLMDRYPQLGLHHLRREKGAGYFATIHQVTDAWAIVHDEGLGPEDVGLHDRTLGDALLRLGELLDRSNYIDYSLMIRRVVDRLEENDGPAQDAAGGIRHLLVDEYQDTNPLQERLIRALRRRCGTLTAVGDDDQSIYGWRGADVQNILGFGDRHPGASRHTLARNFRSSPLIVRSADAFVRAELGSNRLAKDPSAERGEGEGQLGAFGFADRAAEAEWVAGRISALLGSPYADEGGARGLTPADFAVLMRSTGAGERDGSSRSAAFARALDRRGIPYTLEASGSVFARPHVAALRDAMELLRDGPPDRRAVLRFAGERLRPLFPEARDRELTRLYARWGKHLLVPDGSGRRRVRLQKLLQELVDACGVSRADPGEGAMADIGVLSRMLQDAETAYVSIDTRRRFAQILNFMRNLAEDGYQSAKDAAVRRPDAVTVSTVHKAKGLEYPVVFIADAERQRFPGRAGAYSGWLPRETIAGAIGPPRRAYGNDREQEARLFYTAMTRAERYLYVTHAELLPGGRRRRRESPFPARLGAGDGAVVRAAPPADALPPNDLPPAPPRRRVDEAVLPTTFSEIRYYLRCPRDYRYRHVWGFGPPLPAMIGFGRTVHAAVGRLHERYAERAPAAGEAEAIARELFHVKHVPPSRDPERRPGPYERGRDAAARIARDYAEGYASDFGRRRQVEVPFEIPLRDSVLGGSIDLLLHLDGGGAILDASVIDFKTMEDGPGPEYNETLDWTELALQVQLYARAAADVLGVNARTGAVHLLGDGRRVEVPVGEDAVGAAVRNVEWAAERIVAGDFPMRPHTMKCGECDWRPICPRVREEFGTDGTPPPLHLPEGRRTVRAFSQVQDRP